jgi:acyl CoA:acetate/3-ketoacid CoA transferase alpha subunit
MTDIVIKSEEKKEDKKLEVNDVQETLKAADTYQKIKEQNDKLEIELIRQQELRAKIAIGGKSIAGQFTPEKTKEDLAKEEAKKILDMYR